MQQDKANDFLLGEHRTYANEAEDFDCPRGGRVVAEDSCDGMDWKDDDDDD